GFFSSTRQYRAGRPVEPDAGRLSHLRRVLFAPFGQCLPPGDKLKAPAPGASIPAMRHSANPAPPHGSVRPMLLIRLAGQLPREALPVRPSEFADSHTPSPA